MTTTPNAVDWPRVEAIVDSDGKANVLIGGASRVINVNGLSEARTAVVEHVAQAAERIGRQLRATMIDPDGQWSLIVHPDGTVEEDTSVPAKPRVGTERQEFTPQLAPEPLAPVEEARPAQEPEPEVVTLPAPTTPGSNQGWVRQANTPTPVPADETTYPSRRELRQSFLTQEQVDEPAAHGWRGMMSRVGFRMAPSPAERSERDDVSAVSQHWPGPRTIAVVNSKGGAGKTPTTVLLAAVFAHYGGAGVLTWDNNQTRGTLGWRTEQGPHEATLLDLLPQVQHLLGAQAQSADLAHYVHHQTRDRYDVLRSKPTALAREQRVGPEDVDSIHAVASKYYRLVFIDSGNDESDPMWLRMIDHADQLVVATTTRDDHAEAGALLLEALAERDQHSAQLAQNAVVVVTQADSKATPREVTKLADGYKTLARNAVTIPFDPVMVDGILRFGSLRADTRRAWLGAAAAVARGL